MTNTTALTLIIFMGALTSPVCFAVDPQPDQGTSAPTKSEKVDVQSVKQKYWAKGEETELRVVRNRIYTKAGRLEVGIFGGSTSGDPFLSIRQAGGTLGYHFSELLGAELLGWVNFVGASSAQEQFEQQQNKQVNTNPPKSMLAAEVVVSPIYGKLSLLGTSIIYFDLHLLGGFGSTNTNSGRYMTPFVGIGEQVYLTNHFSIRLDYRVTYYKENIQEADNPQVVANVNNNFSNVFTLGVSAFL